jgi:hypothetical protein
MPPIPANAVAPMNRMTRQLRADRDAAYQRIQVAYQDLQTAIQVMQKYAVPAIVGRESTRADAIVRRAMEAWEAATREFTLASREFMAAAEQLDSLELP